MYLYIFLEDQGAGTNDVEKTAADPTQPDPEKGKFLFILLPLTNTSLEDKAAYFIYYGEPWMGAYYYKVTRRVDNFTIEAGDSVAVKSLIGLHTVLFIIRNKQYNKVLLADPAMQLVLDVKFSEVISIEGKASKSQQTQLDELFKTYYEAKVLFYSH